MPGAMIWGMVCFYLLLLIGCGGGRYVLKEGDQGIVAIPTDTDRWPEYYRTKAHDLMMKHFPEGYVIEKEYEVVTGTVTTNHEYTDTDHVGPFVLSEETETRTSTHNTTEYHICYRRR